MATKNLVVSKDVVLVIGLGAFGRELCRMLTERGVSVVAVDKSAEALSQVSDGVSQTVQADSTVESSLRSALSGHVKAAIVAIGEDTEAAILTTSLLSDFEVPYILARASSQLHMRVLSRVGADEVVNLEIEEGRRIAARLASLDIRETIPITERYSLVETGVPRGFVGKSLRELHLREERRINVVTIVRSTVGTDADGRPVEKETVVLPRADTVLHAGDMLILVGTNEDIEKLAEL